jgi:hypothetical protein
MAMINLDLPDPRHEYKRVATYPVGTDRCQLIVTTYWVWKNGQRVETRVTLRTTPPFGRP